MSDVLFKAQHRTHTGRMAQPAIHYDGLELRNIRHSLGLSCAAVGELAGLTGNIVNDAERIAIGGEEARATIQRALRRHITERWPRVQQESRLHYKGQHE